MDHHHQVDRPCSAQMVQHSSPKGNIRRWPEHFNGILSRPSSINDQAIQGGGCQPRSWHSHLRRRGWQRNHANLDGSGTIIFRQKCSSQAVLLSLETWLTCIDHSGKVKPSLKNLKISTSYTSTRERATTGHAITTEGLSLLSFALKILACFHLNHLHKHLDKDHLPVS